MLAVLALGAGGCRAATKVRFAGEVQTCRPGRDYTPPRPGAPAPRPSAPGPGGAR